LLLFAAFIGPTVVVYTISFANVGLVVRERMNVVLAILALAGLSWGTTTDPGTEGIVTPPATAGTSV
jgi:hypothetical protein